MERRRRGIQRLKVVRSSLQRNKPYYHELSAVGRGEEDTRFQPFWNWELQFLKLPKSEMPQYNSLS